MRVARKSWKKTVARLLILPMALSGALAIGSSATASTFKSIQVQGYEQGSAELSESFRSRITRFVNKNPELTVLTCIGFDDTSGAGESALGKTRAATACALALKTNPELRVAGTIGKYDTTRSGFNNGRVVLVLSTQKNPVMTTYFNHNDGSKTRASYSSTAGNEIVLPTPSREGYQFVGWYAKNGSGSLVGVAGERFVPRKNSTLSALWVPFAASVGGGSGSAPPTKLGDLNLPYFTDYSQRMYLNSVFGWTADTLDGNPVDPASTVSIFGCNISSGRPNAGENFYGSSPAGSIPVTSGYGVDALEGFLGSGQIFVTSISASNSSVDFCAVPIIYSLSSPNDQNSDINDINYPYFVDSNGKLLYDYTHELYLDIWLNSYEVDEFGNYELDDDGLYVMKPGVLEVTFTVQTTVGTFVVNLNR